MSSIYNIVSGDALAESLAHRGVAGEVIVCRECLIEGPLGGDTPEEFWGARAAFIRAAFGDSAEDFYEKVITELEKIGNIPAAAEVNLWFGDDLFCQANMWFVLSLLWEAGCEKVFRVFPEGEIDFGSIADKSLTRALERKASFSKQDLVLGTALWKAYKLNERFYFEKLSKTESKVFRDLEECCRAHLERFGDAPRPQRVLREIMAAGKTELGDIFQEFSQREPIYGFGDTQVKRLLENL
jgi:hypothetical protein